MIFRSMGANNRIIGQIGLPWWNIGGNHDLNFESPSARYCRETYKRVFGASYYAFEYGDVLFLMLDNVDYLGPDPAKPRRAGKYRRFFRRTPARLCRQCPQGDGKYGASSPPSCTFLCRTISTRTNLR